MSVTGTAHGRQLKPAAEVGDVAIVAHSSPHGYEVEESNWVAKRDNPQFIISSCKF